MKYNNLSNGKSDGIVLFYMKDEKLKPVALSKNQVDKLDLIIGVAFQDEPIFIDGKTNINVKDGEII